MLVTQLIGERTMTEATANRAANVRERDLEWIENHFLDGADVAKTLRTGTPAAREQTIQGLERLALSMAQQGEAGWWAYSRPKHMHVCRIVRQERALLDAETIKAARHNHQAAVRQLRNSLHQRGWASVSMLKRLGAARGGLLAALAGRRFRDQVR
jgi:hypothetical protein